MRRPRMPRRRPRADIGGSIGRGGGDASALSYFWAPAFGQRNRTMGTERIAGALARPTTRIGAMKNLQFAETIDATPEDVWHAMLDPEPYRVWTSAFGEGGYYEGGWETGDRILFLGPGGMEGMVSEIAESRPHEFVSIRHLGVVQDGVEDTESEEARKWAPAYENYTLRPKGDATELEVSTDVAEEYEEFMSDAWPKALAKLKEVAEKKVISDT